MKEYFFFCIFLFGVGYCQDENPYVNQWDGYSLIQKKEFIRYFTENPIEISSNDLESNYHSLFFDEYLSTKDENTKRMIETHYLLSDYSFGDYFTLYLQSIDEHLKERHKDFFADGINEKLTNYLYLLVLFSRDNSLSVIRKRNQITYSQVYKRTISELKVAYSNKEIVDKLFLQVTSDIKIDNCTQKDFLIFGSSILKDDEISDLTIKIEKIISGNKKISKESSYKIMVFMSLKKFWGNFDPNDLQIYSNSRMSYLSN